MDDIKLTLDTAINSIKKTTDLFYQQNIQEGYQSLKETLDLLTQAVNIVFAIKEKDDGFNIDTEQLMQALSEAMNALEEKDTTLMSDILTYEVKEPFEKLLSDLI